METSFGTAISCIGAGGAYPLAHIFRNGTRAACPGMHDTDKHITCAAQHGLGIGLIYLKDCIASSPTNCGNVIGFSR